MTAPMSIILYFDAFNWDHAHDRHSAWANLIFDLITLLAFLAILILQDSFDDILLLKFS